MEIENKLDKRSILGAFILVTILFFLWGFITVLVDSLIPRIRELFTLSYFQAGLVQFAFFGAYFVLSIPASYILSKIGYKRGIILGLVTMAIGCGLFYPAASYRAFSIFIAAYFILAGGMTILQVAANPYVAVLGSENGASSRLNLAQAFNSLGTAIAPAFGAFLLLRDTIKSSAEIAELSDTARDAYYAAEASAVQLPFLGLAAFILLIALVFVFARLPKLMQGHSSGNYIQALLHKNLLFGVIGILVYVGAEVAIGSYLVNYFMDMNIPALVQSNGALSRLAEWFLQSNLADTDQKAIAGIFVTFYWSGAMVGRFIGSYLTKVYKPSKVLSFFALCAIGLILISMSTVGVISMWSILAVGLFNSIMFPTIFTIAMRGMGDLKPKASGLLCTAIVGGALIPPLYGLMTDGFGFKMAFLLIIACYAYILWYGFKNSNTTIDEK